MYIVIAAHREQLFPALREAIERLRAKVPIWQKEYTLEGEWGCTTLPDSRISKVYNKIIRPIIMVDYCCL